MEIVLSLLVGLLVACSVYLMLSRNLIHFLFALVLLSNAAHLLIFAGGRLTRFEPPVVPEDAPAPVVDVANALPQALVLTAIVISFGLLAFTMVLAYRAFQSLGTVDTDAMRVAEPLRPDERDPAGPEARP